MSAQQQVANPIRIGIVGLGPAGTALVPQIDADARFALTAVCDTRVAGLAEFASRPGVRRHASLEAFCADPDIDVAYVATPTFLHAEHSIAVLASGRHVIVEKPMAVRVDEARAMVAAAATAQRLLLVGHSQSFEPPLRAMRALIDSGRLGRLRAVNNWCYTDWMYKPRHPSEFDRAQGGGVVYRQAAHQVDMLRFLARGASPVALQAVVGQWDPQRPGDGSYSAQMIFADGLVATLFYSGYDHFAATELTFGWGPSGTRDAPSYGRSRRQALTAASAESELKYAEPAKSRRFSMLTPGRNSAFGILVASCEHGDLRVGENGVLVYHDAGRALLPLDHLPNGRAALLDECARGLAGAPLTHDGAWGLANLEVCVGILAAADSQGQERPGWQHPEAPPSPPELIDFVTRNLQPLES